MRDTWPPNMPAAFETKTCPVRACTEEIYPPQIVCRPHMMKLPEYLRHAIADALLYPNSDWDDAMNELCDMAVRLLNARERGGQ